MPKLRPLFDALAIAAVTSTLGIAFGIAIAIMAHKGGF